MRPPAGQIRRIKIMQRSQTTNICDEGTTTASTYHQVGSIGGRPMVEDGDKLTIETDRHCVGKGHVLGYRGKLWIVTGTKDAEDTATITADLIEGARCS